MSDTVVEKNLIILQMNTEIEMWFIVLHTYVIQLFLLYSYMHCLLEKLIGISLLSFLSEY